VGLQAALYQYSSPTVPDVFTNKVGALYSVPFSNIPVTTPTSNWFASAWIYVISTNDVVRDIIAIGAPALSLFIDTDGDIALYDDDSFGNISALGVSLPLLTWMYLGIGSNAGKVFGAAARRNNDAYVTEVAKVFTVSASTVFTGYNGDSIGGGYFSVSFR
jgi:hypothetical protein